MQRRILSVLLVVVLLASVPSTVAAREDPRFETYVPEPTLTPGVEQSVTVQLVADAEDIDEKVKTAKNIKVEVADSSPFTVKSGTQLLGTMRDGDTKTVSVSLAVPADAAAGTYQIPLNVSYEYDFDKTESQIVNATVRIQERARFQIESVEADVPTGDSGSLVLDIENVGSESASDATVTVTSTSPDVTFGQSDSATRYVGDWFATSGIQSGVQTLRFEPSVADDADIESYTLRASVEYDDADGTSKTYRDLTFGLTPVQGVDFEVGDTDSSLRVGQQGDITGTVTNTGGRTARNVVVTFTPSNPNVKAVEPEYAVGTLEPGGSAEFEVSGEVVESANPGPRQFSLVMEYRNTEGDQRTSDPVDVRARVGSEQTFEARDVQSTLEVGQEGTITGTFVNTGETPARNVVLEFQTSNQNVNPVESEVALGTLDAGEATNFSFSVEITEAAGSGSRQFTLGVQYRNEDDDRRTGDPIDIRAQVAEERDTFDVSVSDSGLAAGSSGRVNVSVTNTGSEPITDVSAKVFVDSPLSASDDEAFIEELGPGETRTIVFGLGVGGGAIPKDYPIKVDFRYEDADGDSKISDTYQIPLTVTQRQGGGDLPIPVIVAALVLVLVLGGAVYYYRS